VSAVNRWEKFLSIDRRWIYLLIGLVVLVPFFFVKGNSMVERVMLPAPGSSDSTAMILTPVGPSPLGLGQIVPSQEVISIYNLVDSLGPENAIMIGWDFDPGTEAENQPMGVALLRHAFSRRVPVFITAYSALGQGLAENGLASVFDQRVPGNFAFVRWADWEYCREAGRAGRDSLEAVWETTHDLPEDMRGWVFEGVDLVHLGFLPYFGLVILGMGTSIVTQYPTDMYDNDISEMPILQAHRNLRKVDLAVTLAGSAACMSWVVYGTSRVGLPVAFGVTAVMATDYFPYIQSGQIVGMLGGMRGAAEYEILIADGGYTVPPGETDPVITGRGFRGMDVQSMTHILIILLVIMGNLAYFAGGIHKKTAIKARR
jgi:hypothetical protein